MKETIQQLRVDDYDYALPDERIAKYPLFERDASKLLLYAGGRLAEDTFRGLPAHLPAGALVVFNNTRVIQARLRFRKSTGAQVEVFCLEPHAPADYQQSFATAGSVEWTCLVGNLKRWHSGELVCQLTTPSGPLTLRAERLGQSGTGHVVRLSWTPAALTFAEVLEAAGELPIPPYLHRATEQSDLRTYQTVYSKVKGSVAAPTAGLHFTPRVLADMDARGLERAEITLHVGAGTFRPVKSDVMGGHDMHAEWISVRRDVIDALLRHGGRCVAVGTTSVRTLESLYYIGVRVLRHPDVHPDDLCVAQWEPYELSDTGQPLPTAEEALQALASYMASHSLPALHATTQLLIAPGYTYRIVRTLVTNFHQPRSTLLLLVSALVGSDWRRIYDYALAHDFRFLSYGDSCLLNYE